MNSKTVIFKQPAAARAEEKLWRKQSEQVRRCWLQLSGHHQSAACHRSASACSGATLFPEQKCKTDEKLITSICFSCLCFEFKEPQKRVYTQAASVHVAANDREFFKSVNLTFFFCFCSDFQPNACWDMLSQPHYLTSQSKY